jgi:hypothetical protein
LIQFSECKYIKEGIVCGVVIFLKVDADSVLELEKFLFGPSAEEENLILDFSFEVEPPHGQTVPSCGDDLVCEVRTVFKSIPWADY